MSNERCNRVRIDAGNSADCSHRVPSVQTLNLSGILVTASPGHVDTVAAALAALPGVEVTQCDAASGRIVVVHEAADVGAEVAGFGRIRALAHVVSADLVCHVFDDPAASA